MRNPIAASRTRRLGPWCAAAAAVALCALASPLAAEVYHLELDDGHVFESLYRPEEASWDSSLVLLLTDTGNWIAVPKAEIAHITTETENQGFGKVIDTNTILLGYSPNDLPLPDEEQQFSEIERLQQFYQDQERDYSVQQFVEPGQAGSTGGLPAAGADAGQGFTYFGGGSAGAAPGSGAAPPPPPASTPPE